MMSLLDSYASMIAESFSVHLLLASLALILSSIEPVLELEGSTHESPVSSSVESPDSKLDGEPTIIVHPQK